MTEMRSASDMMHRRYDLSLLTPPNPNLGRKTGRSDGSEGNDSMVMMGRRVVEACEVLWTGGEVRESGGGKVKPTATSPLD